MTTFVRRSIWGLESQQVWDPYTTAYARAVAVMRSRPSTDPTSWAFQAAMHGSYAAPPPGARWNECQHGTWFFLPWHRMYLYWFERIVRAIVVAGGGPDDWALPFWNYSLGRPHNQLPPAFRAPSWNPGTSPAPNPLFSTHRSASYNAGAGLPASVISVRALGSLNYTGRPQPGFGGPVTGFSHQPQAFGQLENVPHNQVHVQVGGQGKDGCAGGWMVDPNCAAQDPIFWLHHANIDRLWSEWIALGGGRANPTDPRWLTGQTFTLYDEGGQEVTMSAGDVLDTVAQLGYEYEPQPPTPGLRPGRARAEVTMSQPSEPRPRAAAPKLAAATAGGVTLGTVRTDARVDLPPAAQHAMRAAVDPGDPSVRHVYLNVEGLEADETPGVSWEVHLNLPPGAGEGAGEGAGDHLAGLISFFGLRRPIEAATDEHGLGPMVHTFDITDLVKGLQHEGQWDDVAATVSFVPVGPDVEEMTATPRIGRVSISYQ